MVRDCGNREGQGGRGPGPRGKEDAQLLGRREEGGEPQVRDQFRRTYVGWGKLGKAVRRRQSGRRGPRMPQGCSAEQMLGEAGGWVRVQRPS